MSGLTPVSNPRAIAQTSDSSDQSTTDSLPSPRQELTELRTENAKFYQEPDGSRTAEIYAEPVHFMSENGEWAEIDTKLVHSGRRQYGYVNHRGPFTVEFSESAHASHMVRARYRGASVTLGAPGTDTTSQAIVSESSVTYADIRPGVDLVFVVTPEGLKESLVLTHRPTEPLSLRFPLLLRGLKSVKRADGQTSLIADDGRVVFSLARGWMLDSSGTDTADPAVSDVVAAKIVERSSQRALTLTPDHQWLMDPARKYPVTINAPVETLRANPDCYIASSHLAKSSYCGLDVLKVGSDSDNERRTLLRFPVDQLPDNTAVKDARLQLYLEDSTRSLPARIQAHRVTSAWGTGATWTRRNRSSQSQWKRAGGDFGSSVNASGTTSGAGYMDLNVTGLVREWHLGDYDNHGILLRQAGESIKDRMTLASSQGFRDHWPKLSVTYNSYPAKVSGLSPKSGAHVGTTTPTLRGIFSDADGGSGKVKYEIRNAASNARVATGAAHATVAAGEDSTWTVPEGILSDGGTYKWRARGFDGTDHSKYSPWRTFTIDTSASVGPEKRFPPPHKRPFRDRRLMPLSEGSPAAVEITSGTHSDQNAFYSNPSLHAEWNYPESEEPVEGFAVELDQTADTVPAPVVDQTLWWFDRDVADGIWYLHVRAIDESGDAGPTTHYRFKVDTTPPSIESLTSTTHPDPETWYSRDFEVVVEPGDDLSGIRFYKMATDRYAESNALTSEPFIPDFVPAPEFPLSLEETVRADGQWYVFVRLRDRAGNWGEIEKVQIRANSSAPGAPSMQSSTHPDPDIEYPFGRFAATWTAGDDDSVKGWAVAVDGSADTDPPTDDLQVNPHFSGSFAPGTWYLHVRGVDDAGAPGETAHLRFQVAAASVSFQTPSNAQTVWGEVPIDLDDSGAGDPIQVEARTSPSDPWRSIGITTTSEPDSQSVLWDTTADVTEGGPWPGATYSIRAVSIPDGDILAEGLSLTVDNELSALERLTADYEAGAISIDDYALHLSELAINPTVLPSSYAPGPTEEVDSQDAIDRTLGLWPDVSSEGQSEIRGFHSVTESGEGGSSECDSRFNVGGPVTYECLTETEHFDVIYTPESLGGGVDPDHVDDLAQWLEDAWNFYDGLGFTVPDEVEVVLSPHQAPGSGVSVAGYLAEDPHITLGETGSSRYLVDHEVFHHVQFAYLTLEDWIGAAFDPGALTWWFEGSAEWGAHQVNELLPEVEQDESYAFDLPDFLGEPQEEIYDLNENHEYGAFILAEYMEEYWGNDAVIEEILARTGVVSPMQAIEDVWESQGSSAASQFEQFRLSSYVLESAGYGLGFYDQDAGTIWRTALADDSATRADVGDPVGLNRAARTSVNLDLDSGETSTGTVELQPTGAAYIELVADGPAAIDLSVSADNNGGIMATVLQFSEYPTLCTEPIRLFVDLDEPEQLTVELEADCTMATIVLTNGRKDCCVEEASWSAKGTRLGRIIDNGTVQLGVRREGQLILGGPEGKVGLNFLPTGDEALAKGCDCEGWGAVEAHSSGAIGGANEAFGGPDNVYVVDFDSTSSSARSEVTIDDQFSVVHDFHPSASDYLFEIDVTMSDLGSDSQPSGFQYRRMMDWDRGGNIDGLNYVDFVTIGTTEPIPSDLPWYVILATNDGFQHPLAGIRTHRGHTGIFTDADSCESEFNPMGCHDGGAMFELDFGELDSLDFGTEHFTLFYGAAPDESTALSALEEVGADAYSLSQGDDPNVDFYQADDNGVTFIFGIKREGDPRPNSSPQIPSFRPWDEILNPLPIWG